MKAEDQYFIEEIEGWITRGGNGMVDDRHIKTEDDKAYYKVTGREKRYVIHGATGVKHMPHRLYEQHIASECFFASGYLKPTRRYLRDSDKTMFKYYDDAEEVLNNIVKFIIWAKNPPRGLAKGQEKNIKNATKDLIRDVADTPEAQRIRASQVGLQVKRRDQLSPLARDLAEERDLCPARD